MRLPMDTAGYAGDFTKEPYGLAANGVDVCIPVGVAAAGMAVGEFLLRLENHDLIAAAVLGGIHSLVAVPERFLQIR